MAARWHPWATCTQPLQASKTGEGGDVEVCAKPCTGASLVRRRASQGLSWLHVARCTVPTTLTAFLDRRNHGRDARKRPRRPSRRPETVLAASTSLVLAYRAIHTRLLLPLRTRPEPIPSRHWHHAHAMPSITAAFWLSLPVLLAALVYQLGLPAFVEHRLPWTSNSTTHCYKAVRTLSSILAQAHCFTVSSGHFSRVFVDDAPAEAKDARTGYVYPGLWDGHGHLKQYGESLDSVSLFGASSMDQVQKRLLDYKTDRPEKGASDEWLRGAGWDQAHYGGRWPTSVCIVISMESRGNPNTGPVGSGNIPKLPGPLHYVGSSRLSLHLGFPKGA